MCSIYWPPTTESTLPLPSPIPFGKWNFHQFPSYWVDLGVVINGAHKYIWLATSYTQGRSALPHLLRSREALGLVPTSEVRGEMTCITSDLDNLIANKSIFRYLLSLLWHPATLEISAYPPEDGEQKQRK